MGKIEMKFFGHEIRKDMQQPGRQRQRYGQADHRQQEGLAEELIHQLPCGTAQGLPDADLLGPLRGLRCHEVDKVDTTQHQEKNRYQHQPVQSGLMGEALVEIIVFGIIFSAWQALITISMF